MKQRIGLLYQNYFVKIPKVKPELEIINILDGEKPTIFWISQNFTGISLFINEVFRVVSVTLKNDKNGDILRKFQSSFIAC